MSCAPILLRMLLAASWLSSLLLAGCQDDKTVRITFDGYLDGVTAVVASGSVGRAEPGQSGPALVSQPVSSALNVVVLHLPADATGQLTIKLDGLADSACVVAQGSQQAAVAEARSHGLHITLSSYLNGCKLNVRTIGPGRIVSKEPGVGAAALKVNCGERCTTTLPKPDELVLLPQPGANGHFLGWGGACTGTAACTPSIPGEGTQVTARFANNQDCSLSNLCWESPLPTGATLHGLWASPSGGLWAVGDAGAIIRNETGFWYAQPSRLTQTLNSVWGRSDSEVWAVGSCGVVLRWDGLQWQDMNVFPGDSCATKPDLRFVWGGGPTEVWVGGTQGALSRFDGVSWQSQTDKLVPFQPQVLNFTGGHGTAADDVWFVIDGGVIFHWNGSEFTFQNLNGAGSASPKAVWAVSREEVWVAGDEGKMIKKGSKGFQSQPTASVGVQQQALWADPAGRLWAVGGSNLQRETSGSWQRYSGQVELNLYAIYGRSANDIWAVGAGGTILHWNGAYWANTTGGVQATGLHVHGLDSDNVWFVGDPGRAIKKVGAAFLSADIRSFPSAVYVVAPDRVWYTSWLANTLKLVGGSEFSEICTTDQHLYALAASGAPGQEQVVAVGDNGKFIRYDSITGKCAEAPPLTDNNNKVHNLTAVWFSSPGDLWIAGDDFLMELNARTGQVVPYDAFGVSLKAIHGSSADNIWAVGSNGDAVHVKGGISQHIKLTDAPVKLNAVWVVDDTEFWFVGEGSYVGRWRRPSSADPDLYLMEKLGVEVFTEFTGVWGSRSAGIYITGQRGEILHYDY